MCNPETFCRHKTYMQNIQYIKYKIHTLTIYFSSLHTVRELWIYVGYVFGLSFFLSFCYWTDLNHILVAELSSDVLVLLNKSLYVCFSKRSKKHQGQEQWSESLWLCGCQDIEILVTAKVFVKAIMKDLSPMFHRRTKAGDRQWFTLFSLNCKSKVDR